MEFIEEINDFLSYPDNCGALLLTGKWGSGKSYAIKQYREKLNGDDRYALAIISLFGVDSIASLHEIVKNEYLSLYSSLFGEKTRRGLEMLSNATEKMQDIAEKVAPESKILSALSMANAVLSYDPLKLISVSNKMGSGDNVREFAVVFDDFERCSIPVKELMGLINEYSENKHIKTIIVADESKIVEARYNEFKEKLITRTITFEPNFDEIIDGILESHPETDNKYKQFLLEHKSQLKKVFQDSGYNNLRILKTCMFDFKRIYKIWPDAVPPKVLADTLYRFCAMEYEAKAGKYTKGEHGIYGFFDPTNPEDNNQSLYTEMEAKYLHNTFRETFYSLAQWAVDGKWDENMFLTELKQTYLIKDIPPTEKFVRMSIWDLEQTDIELGMPEVVQRAHKGEASFGEIISLLKKIHILKNFGIPLPCEVDCGKISNGVKFRKSQFRNGQLEIDHVFRSVWNEEIDPEYHTLCEEIYSVEELAYAWENRWNFMRYLRGETYVSIYDFKGGHIDYFDDELLQLFEEKFFAAKNLKKRELCIALREVSFNNDQCSKDVDKKLTKSNLEKLVAKLEEHIAESKDMISILIARDFKTEIEKKIKETVSDE